MKKLIASLLTLIGLLTVLGIGGIAAAVTVLWWQDKQWQTAASKKEDG